MSEPIPKSVSSSKARGRSNGAAALVEDARAAAQKGHLEIRVWLRLLGCSVKMESLLSHRLRKEFKTSLSRFDVLAQLERFPDGLTMSDLSRRLIVSNGAITGLVDKLMAGGMVMRSAIPATVFSYFTAPACVRKVNAAGSAANVNAASLKISTRSSAVMAT